MAQHPPPPKKKRFDPYMGTHPSTSLSVLLLDIAGLTPQNPTLRSPGLLRSLAASPRFPRPRAALQLHLTPDNRRCGTGGRGDRGDRVFVWGSRFADVCHPTPVGGLQEALEVSAFFVRLEKGDTSLRVALGTGFQGPQSRVIRKRWGRSHSASGSAWNSGRHPVLSNGLLMPSLSKKENGINQQRLVRSTYEN